MKKLLIAGLAVFVLTGCGKEQKEIIASREEQTEAESLQAAAGTLQEQVQAPERYQANFTLDGMELIADAPVVVPEVDQVVVKRTVAEPYTREEFEQFKEIAAAELGISWGEDKEQNIPETEHIFYINNKGKSENGEYSIQWYKDFPEGGSNQLATSYMSMYNENHLYVADSFNILPANPDKEELWNRLLPQAERQAETLGYEEYETVTYSEYTANEKKSLSHYYSIIFTKAPGKIPIPFKEYFPLDGLREAMDWNLEQLRITYSDTEELLHMMMGYRESFTGDTTQPVFLIPFSEIGQIFESVMQSNYEKGNQQTGKDDWKIFDQFQVDKVTFGYSYVHEKTGTGYHKEGKLVPTWDFYGTLSREYRNGEESGGAQEFKAANTVIVTINAMDGTVLYCMVTN